MSYAYSNQYVPVNPGYSTTYNPYSSFKMNYFQPSNVTKLQTPVHKGNYPHGLNAEINFYDPVTGRPGPTVNTFPQVQQMINRPSGYDVNISGNIYDVSKIDEIISKNKGKSLLNNNNIILEPTDENLEKLSKEIDENMQNNDLNLDRINLSSPVSISGNYYDVDKVNRLLYGSYNNGNINGNNNGNINGNNKQIIYNPSDSNLTALSNKLRTNVNQPNNTTNFYDYNLYPNSTWKMHGDLLVHPSLTTTYNGSGVIICEKGYKQNNKYIPTMILCQELNGEFGDFGGMISTFQPGATDNTLAYNAIDKIYQESHGFFNIQSQLFNFSHVDATVDERLSTFYRCFFVCVDGDLLKLDSNQLSNAIQNNSNLHRNLNKQKSIARFSLKELLNSVDYANINNKYTVKDVDGNIVTITPRMVGILKEIKKSSSKLNSIYSDIVPSYYQKNNNGLDTIII